MYQYAAEVVSVYDGDTVRLAVDLGFSVGLRKMTFRLDGIDAPEMPTPEGKAARDFLAALLSTGGGACVVRTKKDKQEKYGRYLATLEVAGKNINQAMLDAGHARPYDGGPRGATMTTEELHRLIKEKLDDLLGSWLVRGQNRAMLQALRRFADDLTESDLQRMLTYLPKEEEGSFMADTKKNAPTPEAEIASQLAEAAAGAGIDLKTLWEKYGPLVLTFLMQILQRLQPVPTPGPFGAAETVGKKADAHECCHAALAHVAAAGCILAHACHEHDHTH